MPATLSGLYVVGYDQYVQSMRQEGNGTILNTSPTIDTMLAALVLHCRQSVSTHDCVVTLLCVIVMSVHSSCFQHDDNAMSAQSMKLKHVTRDGDEHTDSSSNTIETATCAAECI